MLSGGKGIHVVVPLDASKDWPTVKSFAERFSRAIAEAEPRDVHRQHPQGRSARAASSSTGCATSAARPRSCLTPRAPAKARRWRRRSPGTSSTNMTSGNHFTIRDADELLEARDVEGACGLGQGEASVAGCVRPRRRSRFRSLFLLTAASPPELARWRDEAVARDDHPRRLGHRPRPREDRRRRRVRHDLRAGRGRFSADRGQLSDRLGRTAEAEGEKAIWQDLRARLYVSEAS